MRHRFKPGDYVVVVNPLTYYNGVSGTIIRENDESGYWWLVAMDYENDNTFLEAPFEEWELELC